MKLSIFCDLDCCHDHNKNFLFFRILDEFTKSSEDIADIGLHFASNSDYPDTSHSDASLKPASQGSDSPTSCNVTTQDSPPAPSEVPAVQQLPVSFSSCAVFNNYLFHQDPRTGQISLLPVQLRAPQSLLGLDINLSTVQQHFQRLVTAPDNPHDPHLNGLSVPVRPEPQDYPTLPPFISGASIVSDSRVELDSARRYAAQTGNQPPSETASPEVHPALREVIDLLKGEFSLHDSWDKGYEDIVMGM